jgi:3-oxoacyl-[acyl-carrier-protein] synthase-1/3-oxoacyl-[acyl-carrier-protein] synthase II
VLAACASSTVALGIGCRWLALDEADLVIAGGYDALSLFIASGFEALGATTATLPAPFRVERDGMALGEGAALVALVRPSRAPNARGYILGYGAASDAVHITAPDRHAAGLIRAGATALRDAKLPARAIDLVSAHATATPFNDAAESNALDALFGTHLPEVVVHPFKAQIGHTLGAAGALEALAALGALDVGVLPAAAGTGSIEPTFRAKLLERNEPAAARACLKLSAAFGGANAALVLGREPGSFELVERSAVRLLACGKAIERFDLALVTAHARCDPGKLSRLDGFSELAVCAAASALGAFERPLPDRTALLVGTLAASLEPNELFDERRRAGRAVEPRRFPPTSPNLAAGQCSIAFGIRGPSLSVGAGLGAPFEVLRLAADFLDGGDADAVLVVFADEVGALVSDLWRAAGWPVPGHGACAAILANAGSGPVLSLEQLGTAQAEAAESCGSWRGHAPGWPTFRAALLDCTAR